MSNPIRPLPIRSLCALVLLTLGLLEFGVRRTYDAPTPMLDKAQAFVYLTSGKLM